MFGDRHVVCASLIDSEFQQLCTMLKLVGFTVFVLLYCFTGEQL